MRPILIEIWKRKLDDFHPLSLGARRVVRQLLEKQPLVRAERPEGELRRSVAGFDHTRVAHFCDVLVVLVPGNRVKGQFGLFILHLERTGVNGNQHIFFGESGFGVEAPPAKAEIP